MGALQSTLWDSSVQHWADQISNPAIAENIRLQDAQALAQYLNTSTGQNLVQTLDKISNRLTLAQKEEFNRYLILRSVRNLGEVLHSA